MNKQDLREAIRDRIVEAADAYGSQYAARKRVLELGMESAHWGRILRAWRDPTARDLAIIAVAFGVSASMLVEGFEDD